MVKREVIEMKRKHRLGRIISLLIAVSLLLGVTVVGALAEDSSAGDAVAQSETTAFPWDGYTRITMADYGNISASTDVDGTAYKAATSGTCSKNMEKSYVDVDIKIHETLTKLGYLDFLGDGSWTDSFRMKVNSEGKLNFAYVGSHATMTSAKSFDIIPESYEIAADKFFNLKMLIDIADKADDTSKQNVTVQFYLNKKYAGTMSWIEEQDHGHGYLYMNCTSYSLRTPQPWSDYTRITMENYGIDASQGKGSEPYSESMVGSTECSVNKTYLDVDMKLNFDGSFGTVFYYLCGDDPWYGLRLTPYTSGFGVHHTKVGKLGTEWIGCRLPENEFFNLKLLTDITDNADNPAKQDVQVRVYLNDAFLETLTWTESKEELHYKCFFDYKKAYSLRTPLLLEDIDYGYEIAVYRKAVNADQEYTSYPEKTGYVFGGWYSDVYLTEPLDASVTSGVAYAKFVQADVLTVKFQKLVGASKEDATTKLRAVTSVDTLDYEYVGFKRVVEGASEKIYKTKSVYKTIKGTVNGETYTYTPSDISEASKYLMALSINNIPQAFYNKDITITPVWKTLDGTIVTGTARTIQLFPDNVGEEGDLVLYGGEEFQNDNEAYYKSTWIY